MSNTGVFFIDKQGMSSKPDFPHIAIFGPNARLHLIHSFYNIHPHIKKLGQTTTYDPGFSTAVEL